jgi:hypothetical protein
VDDSGARKLVTDPYSRSSWLLPAGTCLSHAQDVQAEVLFEGVEVAVRVEEGVAALDAIGGDEAIDS